MAPLAIPTLADAFGWEMSFIIIGALGFVWAGLWLFLYTSPSKSRFVNPSELITGYLMKLGYSALPSIVPDLAEHTIVVTYGNTGTSSVLVAKSGVIIQVRDAKTHQLIATSEAEGTSLEDETYAVKRAIYRALDNIFATNQ
jgi:hypothetical protein